MERREPKSFTKRLVIMIGIHISYYVNPEQYFKTPRIALLNPSAYMSTIYELKKIRRDFLAFVKDIMICSVLKIYTYFVTPRRSDRNWLLKYGRKTHGQKECRVHRTAEFSEAQKLFLYLTFLFFSVLL